MCREVSKVKVRLSGDPSGGELSETEEKDEFYWGLVCDRIHEDVLAEVRKCLANRGVV